MRSITLLPPDPPAVPEAVRAVLDAEWVVFGPGSWFTSVLPHLLVPGLASALHGTTARRLVVLNLAPQPGETEAPPREAAEALLALLDSDDPPLRTVVGRGAHDMVRMALEQRRDDYRKDSPSNWPAT